MINHNKEILIGKRSKTSDHFPNYWEFPGGKIEAGERAEQALIRELKEELSITVEERHLNPFQFITHPYKDFLALILIFKCCRWSGQIQKNVHDQLTWAIQDQLGKYNFLPANTKLIQRLKNENI